MHKLMSASASGQEVRTALFVPASRVDRARKALGSDADLVILDLEDAVASEDKAAARDKLAILCEARAAGRIAIRINASGTPWFDADVSACAALREVAVVMVPKAESAAQLQAVRAGKPLLPLVETARGLAHLHEIAAAAGVERLAFGSIDLALDLGLHDGGTGAQEMLNQARYGIVVHSRAAGIGAPLDGVFAGIADMDGLARAAQAARGRGFGGMMCIHPAQLETVARAFRPSDAEIAWATRLLASAATSDAGAFAFEGGMVDAPVIAKAQRILGVGG